MSEPYSRIYWSVMSDEKFDGIRDDVRLFGSWSLLLVVADMAWPAPAYVPPVVPRAAIARLSDCGLIDLLDRHRYRVHGLDKERDKRSQSARNAAALRWQSNGNAETMPSRGIAETEHRQSSARIADALDWDDGRRDLEAFLLVRHRAPTPAQRDFLDAYQRVFDATGPERAEKLILSHPDDPIGALKADLAAFRKERAEAAAPDEQRQSATSRRQVENTLATNHRNGWHEAEPDDRCPLCRSAA
jgi:hypothetical protein